MSQKINPSYGSEVNENAQEFSFLTHVPGLPAPSRKYENLVLLNKDDGCLYHCLELNGQWNWEAITSGINRRYVLSVNTIITGTSDNDLLAENVYAALREIVTGMQKYGDTFDQLSANATLAEAMDLYNQLIVHVNRTCGTSLVAAVTGSSGDTIPQFAAKVNLLIAEVNPHANVSIDHQKLITFLTTIANLSEDADHATALAAIRTSARSILGLD